MIMMMVMLLIFTDNNDDAANTDDAADTVTDDTGGDTANGCSGHDAEKGGVVGNRHDGHADDVADADSAYWY